MRRFLARLRRRLRLVWAWATTAWVAPGVVAAALAVVALGRVVPWGWPEPLAAALVVAALLVVVIAAAIQRLPLPVVARAADRGLATHDSFAAALQFERLEGSFGERIATRAESLAAGADPATAAPFRPYGRRWLVAAVLAVGAVGLAVAPNPQDGIRAERAETRALLDALAEQLTEEAEALAEELPDGAEDPAVAELLAAAEELRQADDLEAAQEALAEAQDALDARRSDNLAAQQAAAQGLERSLAQRPIAEAGESAAEQLAAAAEELDGLTAEEQEALAERLADLAATQELGSPEVAAALAEAAEALASGDVPGAQAALGEAAQAQGAANAAVDGQLNLDQAAAALAEAQAAAEGSGQGAGEGQGEGSGDGQGQGDGDGQGAGQGQGQGAGQGQGGDGAQGEVGGAQGGTGEGQGGVGTPGGTDQPRIDTNDDQRATVVDTAEATDETPLGGTPTGDAAEVIGEGDGPTTASLAQVPLSEVVADYTRRATEAADAQQLPADQQELVGDYFDLLSQ
ncbi:MAG: hypothetical protein AAGE88_16740 [Actinomycetota bacterium]